MQIEMHRRGLEPLTPWSEARYSIQLSYQCKLRFIEVILAEKTLIDNSPHS